jgi:hypothetical protein
VFLVRGVHIDHKALAVDLDRFDSPTATRDTVSTRVFRLSVLGCDECPLPVLAGAFPCCRMTARPAYTWLTL